MKQIRNLLVIVDPTATEHPSVSKAAVLARVFNARVELYVCDTRAAREMRLVAERAKDPKRALTINMKPLLESLAEPLRAQGLDVSTECDYADVLVHGLLERLRRTSADLVVKDTHHHSLLQRTLFTNTDWHLIRECPKPLLLVKPSSWRAQLSVLAAVDPGNVNDKPAELDREILGWAKALSERSGGSLQVSHVYVPLTIAATTGDVVAPFASTLTPEAMAFEDKQKRKDLSGLVAPFGIPMEHVHLDLGVASDVLPQKARELNADVLVMGAIARTGLSRIFIGSTAERVLESLPCDVMVVKAEKRLAVG